MMKVDLDKMRTIIELLNNHFLSVDNLAEVEYPINIVYGSEEWLYYIFYSCLLDYGMRSKVYHRNLIATYEKYPNIFRPQDVVELFNSNEKELSLIIKENIKPRYPQVALKK